MFVNENSFIFVSIVDDVALGNDIAVVELSEPVEFNDYARPVCLPSHFQAVENEACQAIGRGAIVRDGSVLSSTPREGTLYVTSNVTCFASLLIPRSSRDGKMMCARDPERKVDTCSGDSGGPILCVDPYQRNRWIFAGVTSFGADGCGADGLPGAYTVVSYYSKWINSTMESMLQNRRTTTQRPSITSSAARPGGFWADTIVGRLTTVFPGGGNVTPANNPGNNPDDNNDEEMTSEEAVLLRLFLQGLSDLFGGIGRRRHSNGGRRSQQIFNPPQHNNNNHGTQFNEFQLP